LDPDIKSTNSNAKESYVKMFHVGRASEQISADPVLLRVYILLTGKSILSNGSIYIHGRVHQSHQPFS
jgi:hypothetical protein